MKINRRDALASFAVLAELAASGRYASAQGQPAPADVHQVFQHDLPDVNLEGWEVTVSHVDFPPGRVGAVHHHAGFVLAYVLEGEIVSKVSGQGPERTFKTGEMFYEQPGATHEASRNASQTRPARLLAMIFAKKGSTLTTPGPARV